MKLVLPYFGKPVKNLHSFESRELLSKFKAKYLEILFVIRM